MNKDEVGQGLSQLAESLLDACNKGEVGFDQRLDAFKAVTSYYVGVAKIKAKTDDDDNSGVPNFERFTRDIQAASDRG